ncbi:Outer membrane protein assembly factor BamD [Stieleria neptunia]|uniref:Outer membrane protein assembly factor BamD n=1 Tax=Stieleria neptunia TaxID=2527979 RepID=A0A518I1Z0_9BACT|nr:tetratricopeptide repeat protein [Stieleria neptunia]QDV47125.1 Outer membrane protein assembly factor BamD [Stieleria neptunia]
MKTNTAVLAALLMLMAVCTTGCDNQPSGEAFHRGRELLIKGQFDAAESVLAEFETQHPGHALSSRTRFLRAKAKLGAGDLPQARQLFQQTIDRFPKSDEADKARYKLAFIELLDGNTQQAEQQFQDIVNQSRSIYIAEAHAVRAMLDRQRAE